MDKKDIIISEKLIDIDSLSLTKETRDYVKKESAKLLERFYNEGLSKPVIYSNEAELGFSIEKELSPLEGYILKYYKIDRVVSDAFIKLNQKCGMSEELETSIDIVSNSGATKEVVLDSVGLNSSSSIGSKYRDKINKTGDKSISGLIGTLLVMQQYDVNEDMLKNAEKIKNLSTERNTSTDKLNSVTKTFLTIGAGLNMIIGFILIITLSLIVSKIIDIPFTQSFLAAFIVYIAETVQTLVAHKLCNDIIPDVPYIINDVDVIKVSTVGELGSNNEREIVPLALSTILMSGLTDIHSSIFSKFSNDTKKLMIFTNRFLAVYSAYRLGKRYLRDIVATSIASYMLIIILTVLFSS